MKADQPILTNAWQYVEFVIDFFIHSSGHHLHFRECVGYWVHTWEKSVILFLVPDHCLLLVT